MLDLTATLLGRPPSAEDGGWVTKPATDDYWYGSRGMASDTGLEIDEDAALRYTTVFQCVAKISKTVATLPFPVYERLEKGGKQKAADHPYYALIHDCPNDEMDSVVFWETMTANLLLWGNAYAEMVRDSDGIVCALWPLLSRTITPRRDDRNRLYFEHRSDDGRLRDIPAWRMLRLTGLSLNGITGLSVIGYWREAIASGLAAAKFVSRFYRNGAAPSGVLETPKGLSDKAYRRLKGSFHTEHTGLDNVGNVPLLEEDTKYKPIGMPLKDAQFLELRKFQRTEVCGLYDTPPHKIGDLDRATLSNIEDQNIQWVTDCIGPLCVREAKAVNRQLFQNDRQYFCEHKLDAILRGDMLSRYQAHAIGRQWGWRSVNEIKAIENENPIEGGDTYLEPLNMVDSSQNGGRKQDGNGSRDDAREAIRPIVEDACRRLVAREVKAAANAWRKHQRDDDRAAFLKWLDGFYADAVPLAVEILQPAIKALMLAAKTLTGTEAPGLAARALAEQYAACSLAALRDAAQAGEVADELKRWEAEKPSQLAKTIMNNI